MQTPTLVAILNEQSVWYRQIMMDGRPLPVDPLPTWNGYSVGKWEGDTLVAESNGFRDDLWLDANGSPMTASAKISERFRRPVRPPESLSRSTIPRRTRPDRHPQRRSWPIRICWTTSAGKTRRTSTIEVGRQVAPGFQPRARP